MKLYFSPGACSQSPHIVLRELRLPVELVKVNTKTHTYAEGANFYDVNAKGYVPVLELDNGERLTEGPAIVQYLADQKPEAGLAGKAGTLERARVAEWLNFLTSEVHKPFGAFFSPDTPEDYKPIAMKKLRTRLDWIEKELKDRQFLTGDHFSVADAYLFVLSGWGAHVGLKLEDWPAIKAWRERVGQRPAVREALKAEGLAK